MKTMVPTAMASAAALTAGRRGVGGGMGGFFVVKGDWWAGADRDRPRSVSGRTSRVLSVEQRIDRLWGRVVAAEGEHPTGCRGGGTLGWASVAGRVLAGAGGSWGCRDRGL